MARFAPAFALFGTLSVTLALGSGGAALGQTVADYRAALAGAPIAETQPGVAELYCRPLLNYLFTSIPEGERIGVVVPLVALGSGSDPAAARKREICAEVRRQGVIVFDAGSGEEIVTPPQMTDGSGASGPYYPDLPQMGRDPELGPALEGDPAPVQRRVPGRRPVEVR